MDYSVLLAIVGTISAMTLGWLGKARTAKKDVVEDAGAVITLQNNVEYIRRGVDDIRLDQRVQAQRIDTLSERVTRTEESTKSLHKRVDKMEE
ncbi:hypothetical protein J2Z32_003725 [Paenibacillus turicensis]|uniref:Holin n=1 Tax=Paenibacillus turicensis TaxID=160487 RepID=A0ABS4FX12_9BACL|nr:hypothetical protein [Paenibacillus turicensis]MBP1907060.1 hypothetical protein [Paenibacillus turicensis]